MKTEISLSCDWIMWTPPVNRGVGRGLKVRGQKWRVQSACCRNLINIHEFVAQKQLYTCVLSRAVQYTDVTWTDFRVVKLSHAATATGFCTTGKCIASLLVFINLFIACDVKKVLKWGALWKVGGTSPPCPPSSTSLVKLKALHNKPERTCVLDVQFCCHRIDHVEACTL